MRPTIQRLSGILPIDRKFLLEGDVARVDGIDDVMNCHAKRPSFNNRPEIRVFAATMRQQAGVQIEHRAPRNGFKDRRAQEMRPPCQDRHVGSQPPERFGAIGLFCAVPRYDKIRSEPVTKPGKCRRLLVAVYNDRDQRIAVF